MVSCEHGAIATNVITNEMSNCAGKENGAAQKHLPFHKFQCVMYAIWGLLTNYKYVSIVRIWNDFNLQQLEEWTIVAINSVLMFCIPVKFNIMHLCVILLPSNM